MPNNFLDQIEQILVEEFVQISEQIDAGKLQDSFLWRCLHLGRALACHLVDETGVNSEALQVARTHLQKNKYSLGPERHHEAFFRTHLLQILDLFATQSAYTAALRRIEKPHANQIAERLIRQSLLLPETHVVQDVDARRAALSALIVPLRQNVGSCFATAPAILIQQENPLQLLADLEALFTQGALRRVVGDVECRVPLSPTPGVGDLLRPIFFAGLSQEQGVQLLCSPSLQTSLQAVGISKEQVVPLLKKSKALHKLDNQFAHLCVDSLLRAILLAHFDLSKKDLDIYFNQKNSFSTKKIFVQTPRTRGKNVLQIERYLKAYQAAKRAFVAMTDHALLKAWEFTLASMSESKADFAKWNLTICLGLDPKEPEGLGQRIQVQIQEDIDAINREIEEAQSNYDHIFTQAKFIEGRIARAASDSEASWLQADYRVKKLELERVLKNRDEIYEKGHKLRELFSFMLNFYSNKFQEYFQEVYDAQMHDLVPTLYDDSPAGFRLLYKHGRTNPSMWSYIYSLSEFQQHLAAFFTATEIELFHTHEFESIKEQITRLVTLCVQQVSDPLFLEAGFHRLSRAYKEPPVQKPLEQLDRIKRKPWAYISGGTMTTLLSCYFENPKQMEQQSRWVENETELLAFYLDTLRDLPLNTQKRYLEDPGASMLAFSPTHAFLLKPGWKKFAQGWQSSLYSYTYIRDQWVQPAKRFSAQLLLNREMMSAIIAFILPKIPTGYRALFRKKLSHFSLALHPFEFRKEVVKILGNERWLLTNFALLIEELDSALYTLLPFFDRSELEEKVSCILAALGIGPVKLSAKELPAILSAQDLHEIVAIELRNIENRDHSATFWHQKILHAMQKLGYAMPEPILCADTNWSKSYFGFCVSPATLRLEFWRFDAIGLSGRPISAWKPYLDGTTRREWGLLTDSREYEAQS